MSYGIKYKIPFTQYELQISKKEYSGAFVTLEAATPAVRHSWNNDEPDAAIKGSALDCNVIGVPLLDFYSDNDDEYLGQLFYGSNLLFAGYLIQEDCIEPVDDLKHVVTLSFMDNIGLLKEIKLNEALSLIGSTASKITLLEIIKACIYATGILLPVDIYANLKEDTQSTDTPFFAQTLVAKESFLESERVYKDCYSIFEGILSDFHCTIVQANGKWNIKRCFEVAPKAFHYANDFTLTGTGIYSNAVAFGKDQPLFPVYPYDQRIVRPFKTVQEKFEYRLPGQILKNADLKDLGALLTTYTIGEEQYRPNEDADTTNDYNVTVKEYAFPDWFDSDLAPQTAAFFIRVFTDPFGQEFERFIVVKNDHIRSTPLEGTAGDAIKFSFNVRTAQPVGLPAGITYIVKLTDGSRTVYAANNGTWRNIIGYQKQFTTAMTDWQSVSLEVPRLPFDGLVTVYLSTITPNTNSETHYNDLRFEYVSYINESTRITGQTHLTKQDSTTKNKSEADRIVDDSPRNFIAGTLFLNALNGIIQKRTSLWNSGKRLGEVTTGELKQWRSKARTIFEGTLYAEEFEDINLSPLMTFTNPAFPLLACVPGTMTIDYANKTCTGTLHEFYKSSEIAVVNDYTFDYIFNNK